MNKRKFYLAFLIAALMLASFPVAGVFASSSTQEGSPGTNDLEQSWANKLGQLQTEISIFNNFQTRPGLNGNNSNVGQYLDKYSATLSAAQSLIVNGSGFDINGNVVNQGQARRSVQQMNEFLSLMRGLRQKITEAGGNNNNNNNNNSANNAVASGGVSIPVTGGDANTTTQPVNQNNNQGTSLAASWGNQFRELQSAQAWFNRFHTRPGENRNNAEISRYLDRYAFALQQANAIIVAGTGNSNSQTDNNGNGNGQGTNWGSPQQQLGMYLQMMRGLRQKIAESGNNNDNNNNANNNTTNTNTGTNP